MHASKDIHADAFFQKQTISNEFTIHFGNIDVHIEFGCNEKQFCSTVTSIKVKKHYGGPPGGIGKGKITFFCVCVHLIKVGISGFHSPIHG